MKIDTRAVEIGTAAVNLAINIGRIRICSPLQTLIAQYQTYRQSDGKIPVDVPIMNAMRSVITSFNSVAIPKPTPVKLTSAPSAAADTYAGY